MAFPAEGGGGRSAPVRERGFTLLEIVVAMVLLGLGLALAFSAISGSLSLSQRAFEHEAAMMLARARLDEVAASPQDDVVDEGTEDVYGGVRYAYKIEVRPVVLLPPSLRSRVPLGFALDEITITVFWGEESRQRSFSLSRYRVRDLPGSAAGAPASPAGAPGGVPPSGGGAR